MKKKSRENQLVVYQTKTGAIEFRGDVQNETVWARQAQIADVFDVERSVVTKHIRNILNDKELDKKSVCAKFAHTAEDGKIYRTQFYNLDVILAVGYRTNSSRAIEFRQWATRTLRQYITDGYAINKRRIAKNYEQFLGAVDQIRALLPEGGLVDAESALELVRAFADTWISLDAYDKDKLAATGATKRAFVVTANELVRVLEEFKRELIKSGAATDLFGMERQAGSVSGIVGNVMQSFGGRPVYATVEEKAAHLLYFFIKNHPFADGNKRSGAYAFIWYLKKAGVLNRVKLTPPALTALTLFVAESDPKNKDRLIRLILQLLKK